jgi:hypothetical protein
MPFAVSAAVANFLPVTIREFLWDDTLHAGSLNPTALKREKMNKPAYPTPLPARIGEAVKYPPPKGATPGTPVAYGKIIDYAAADPAWDRRLGLVLLHS